MDDKTTDEESTDQPAQESQDQTVEESADQPNEEVEEDGTDDASQSKEDEETTPASDDEQLIEIDGKEYTLEEARELISKGEDYTRKTQQLAEERRRLQQAGLPPPAQPEPTPEQQEIQKAREALKKYNVVFEDEVEKKIKASQLQAQLESEFNAFRSKYRVDNETAALVRVAGNAYQMPYEKAYEKFWLGKAKKVVKRKTVGASRKGTTPVTGKRDGVLTREDIAKMTPEEYAKNSGKIEELLTKGEL